MPELPEVETTRRGIEPHLIDQRIKQVIVRQPQLRWPIPSDINEIMRQQTVHSVTRRSKYLLINTSNGTLLIHLGMSGSLSIANQQTSLKKHDHVDIITENNTILRYHDPRRFGAILWTNEPNSHPRLLSLGPEPLSRSFNTQHLYKACQSKSAAIKSVIMNANIVVGVGNIYANEALFHCGIHPLTPAKQLSSEQCRGLCQQIKKTLKKAIAAGGTTLKDFSNAEGKPGYFQQKLWIYGRAGETCHHCKTPIERLTQQQRSSFICTQCQPLHTS
ncbi:MAG: bifunctional DNA-formamidopyrimidine glycosylase/DNA-(apurinic or apyrimidinic site) lyase [Coxiellaceae bacterium]|nr:bifunctional DNA-formamidopyrimidine glycosylase/DNA-(apurinic or apyrimidinic site) lyase [Coxiellaceae bacterium]